VPVFTARNLIVSLPAAYLLVSRAALRLPRDPRLAAALALGLVGMGGFGVLESGRYWRRPHKEQFREVVQALGAASWDPAATRILAYPAFGFDYYLARQNAPRSVDFALSPRASLEAAAPFLAAEAPKTLWLLTAHADADPELLLALERDYALTLEERFYRAWLRRYERRPPGPSEAFQATGRGFDSSPEHQDVRSDHLQQTTGRSNWQKPRENPPSPIIVIPVSVSESVDHP
jgi:hypothetical protein